MGNPFEAPPPSGMPCPVCKGSKEKDGKPCPECNGTGLKK